MTRELIKFGASYCVPCKALSAELERAVLSGRLPGVTITEVDIETEDGAKRANEEKVSTLPTLIFIADGEETGRIAGICGIDKIREMLGL